MWWKDKFSWNSWIACCILLVGLPKLVRFWCCLSPKRCKTMLWYHRTQLNPLLLVNDQYHEYREDWSCHNIAKPIRSLKSVTLSRSISWKTSFSDISRKCISPNMIRAVNRLYWSIHTKDESKRETAFAFIFGVNWLWRCGFPALLRIFFQLTAPIIFGDMHFLSISENELCFGRFKYYHCSCDKQRHW